MKHPDLLMQMLLLRLEGWSEYALARKYEADKTTIEHWCDKFEIIPVLGTQTQPRQVTVVTFTPAPSKKQYKFQYIFDEDEKFPEPKSYDQIRVQSRKRQLIRLGVLTV